jgi:hypothetical protein
MRQEKLQRNKEGRKAGRALITFQNCPIFSQKSDSFGNEKKSHSHGNEI